MTARAHHSVSFSRRLRENWREFKRAKPGHRFEERYRRRRNQGHSFVSKVLSLTVGFVLFVLGLILLPAPGPGFLVIFLGAGMIAEESQLAARALDWTELRLYRIGQRAVRFWRNASLVQKALVVLLAVSLSALLAFAAWSLFFD